MAMVLVGCGSNGTPHEEGARITVPKPLSGAAVDDYLIGSKVSVYDADGESVGECTTGEFGIFHCDVDKESEHYTIIVSGGKLDNDGNASTQEDQTNFEGRSLAAVVDANHSVIVSPATTKIVANAMGEEVVIDGNFSYYDGELRPKDLQKHLDHIAKAEANSVVPSLLSTQGDEQILENARQVRAMLDHNISVVQSVSLDDAQNFRLQILHVNDTHSHVEPTRIKIKLGGKKTYVYTGGYARLAHFVKSIKSGDDQALFVHAGDMFQGTLYFNLFDGNASIESFDKMPLDAYTFGNHEFDRGEEFLRDNLVSRYSFPVVDANVKTTDEKLKPYIHPYIIKEIGAERVAISGLTVDASKLSSPGPTITFADAIESAKETVEELEAKGIDKIIFLTHLGYDRDKFLTQQVPEIDVIVGGHSHTLLGDFSNVGLTSQGTYPTVVDHDDSKTLILQAWKWEQVVGDLNVVFDKEGHVVKYVGTPVMLLGDTFLRKNENGDKVEVSAQERAEILQQIASMPNVTVEEPDSAVQAVVDTYKPKVDEMMHKVIGVATTDLVHVRLPETMDEDNGKVLSNGSQIAPLVVKAMYEKAKEYGGCDFAIQNAGGIRISIPEGNVTVGEIMQMLPFGNTLVTVQMQGSDIKTMLENAVDRSYIQKENTGAFPYLSNAKMSIDTTQPKWSRIVELKVKEGDSWVDLDPDKTYRIATNSYMASGGDYYQEMVDDATDKYDTGFVYANIFIEYVQKVGELKPYNAPKKSYNKFSIDLSA